MMHGRIKQCLIAFLPLLRRFNPAEPVVEKSICSSKIYNDYFIQNAKYSSQQKCPEVSIATVNTLI
jgi:hypothetical protein